MSPERGRAVDQNRRRGHSFDLKTVPSQPAGSLRRHTHAWSRFVTQPHSPASTLASARAQSGRKQTFFVCFACVIWSSRCTSNESLRRLNKAWSALTQPGSGCPGTLNWDHRRETSGNKIPHGHQGQAPPTGDSIFYLTWSIFRSQGAKTKIIFVAMQHLCQG